MQVTPASTDGRRPRLFAIARSRDAQLFVLRAALTEEEGARLRTVCDRLIEMGSLALFRVDAPLSEAGDWQQVVRHLREALGRFCVDTAIAAADAPATPTPKPQTLVPVWPFERLADDPDVLTACGLFMGAPITFEALPVIDADLTKPAGGSTKRFDAWRNAVNGGAMLGTVAIPHQEAAHAVFASVRAG